MSEDFKWPEFSGKGYVDSLVNYFLEKQRKHWDTFIDIGPGVKDSEAYVVSTRLPEKKILGFEPHPERYGALKDSYPGTLSNLAVAGHTGNMLGWKNDSKDPHRQFYSSNITGWLQSESVQCITVDDIIESNPEIQSAVIWADMEAGELDMLRGCVRSLMRYKISAFNIEINFMDEADLPSGYPLWWEVIEFLRSFDFVPIGSSSARETLGTFESRAFPGVHVINSYNTKTAGPHADMFFGRHPVANELGPGYFSVARD